MEIVHGNSNDFNDLINDNIVVVDFYANWCGPCKMLIPVLDEFAKLNNNVKVVKINVDEEEDLARKYGIMSIPALLLFKNGELIDNQTGFVPLNKLNEWVNSHK